ncbi:MAG: S8 family serine peptidase [Actinomycetes bacterium]
MRRPLVSAALLLGLGAASVAAAPAHDPSSLTATAAQGTWVTVHLDGPATQAHVDALTARGLTGLGWDGGAQAYAAWAPAGTDLDGIAGVRRVEVRPAALDGQVDLAGTGTLLVRVAGSEAAALEGALRAIGRVLEVSPVADQPGTIDLRVAAPAAAAAALVDLPGVLYVGPSWSQAVPEDEATNAVLARLGTSSTQPAPGYRDFLDGIGLDGSGVTVSVNDTGVESDHPDLEVAGVIDYSRAGEPVDLGGHGTHVAGIVAGQGTAGGNGLLAADGAGFRPGQGVAPGAALVDQNFLATTRATAPSYGRMVKDALAAGASIWNASWTSGEGAGKGYLASAATLDELVRDGDPDTPGAQPFTMVFSAGNSGSGPRTITAPKEAKNLIVTASVDSPIRARVLPRSGNPEQPSSFSSRGPALDGRIGITVAAPGGDVRSTRSFVGDSCNIPIDAAGAALYSFCSGTSMASPHAAGAAALISQWWEQQTGRAATPALHKAMMVNSARDIGMKDIPNANEGWGIIDLEEMFDGALERTVLDGDEVLTEPGETHTLTVDVTDTTRPFKVTLAWLDPAGLPDAAPALVNDLDLVVTAPDGTTYRGNDFARGTSVPGGVADRLENLENVFVAAPQAGTWTVTVAAHALPADGAIGRGDGTDQDYTLVVSRAAAQAATVSTVSATATVVFSGPVR